MNKKANGTQQQGEINTKGSLTLTRQMVEQFFLLFLKS